MVSQPFFSIILPTFNRARFLPKAIDSILGQQFTDWELIIVDDGSDDDTQKVVKNYQDHRIRYQYQVHSERSTARNRGIQVSRGVYICFVDSDDFFLPNHLSSLYQTIKASGFAEGIFITNGFLSEGSKRTNIIPVVNEANALVAVWDTGLAPIFSCLSRTVFDELIFDEEIFYVEDYKFFLETLLRFPYYLTNEITCVLVEHPDRGTNTQSLEQLQEMLDMKRSVKRALLNDYPSLKTTLGPEFIRLQEKKDYLFFASKAFRCGQVIWGRSLLQKSLGFPFSRKLVVPYIKLLALVLNQYLKRLLLK